MKDKISSNNIHIVCNPLNAVDSGHRSPKHEITLFMFWKDNV